MNVKRKINALVGNTIKELNVTIDPEVGSAYNLRLTLSYSMLYNIDNNIKWVCISKLTDSIFGSNV